MACRQSTLEHVYHNTVKPPPPAVTHHASPLRPLVLAKPALLPVFMDLPSRDIPCE